MSYGRKKKFTHALVALLIALTGLIAATGTANADPEQEIDAAQAKVENLQRLAEEASERYNHARVKAVELKTRLDALTADLKRQQETVADMRLEVATQVVDQFQGSVLSTSTQMVLSEDPDAFLDNLNAISTYNSQQGQVLAHFEDELDRLELRQDAVGEEAEKLAALQQKMLKEKEKVDARSAEAQEVLDELEAEQREELMAAQASSYSVDVPDVAASGRAKVAVDYALAQVGKTYVYGAAGPNSFDCSGLTMRAWGAAGVGLPHSSRAQQGSGRPVSQGELIPGDLVFYYSPVSHVGIYIGGGQVVSALNPSSGIQVHSLHMMPYVGAVRPG